MNVIINAGQDYGFDPLGNGLWKLVPSGKIVNKTELDAFKDSRPKREVKNDCFGLSWDQIEAGQGGKLKRDV